MIEDRVCLEHLKCNPHRVINILAVSDSGGLSLNVMIAYFFCITHSAHDHQSQVRG